MMFRDAVATAAIALISALSGANAADVTMGDTWCDQNLPIYAKNMYLNCGNEGDGCTLGTSAGITAKVYYNGVYGTVSNNKAYATVSVSKYQDLTSYVTDYSLSKEIYALREINLCNSVHSQNGGCPSDGWYTLSASTTLPSMGDKDWFLTGQHFGAEIKIYSDSYGTNLIGDCTARFTTTVTAGAGNYMDPPDAGKAAAITLLVALVAAVGIGIGCWWMDQRDKELEANDFEMLEDPRSKQNAVV